MPKAKCNGTYPGYLPFPYGNAYTNCYIKSEKYQESWYNFQAEGDTYLLSLESRYIIAHDICNECTDYAVFSIPKADFKTHSDGNVSYTHRAFSIQSNFTHAEG